MIRQMEAELRASAQQFTNIFENSLCGFSLVTLDGQYFRVNRAFCDMLGYSEAEILTKSLRDITHPDDLGSDLDKLQSLVSGRIQAFQRDKRYVHRDGQTVWIHLGVTLLLDAKNEPIHFLSQTLDITDRKLAETALRESENSFRIMTEGLPQIVFLTQADGRNIFSNQRWVEYTGLSVEESYGFGGIKSFHPEDAASAFAYSQGEMAKGRAHEFKSRLRKADGTYQWMLIRVLPICDETGRVVKWIGTCTNIDELQNALEAARSSKETIAEQAALLDQAHDAIMLQDFEGNILFWNKGAERLYGWTAGEVLGQKFGELCKVPPGLRIESVGILQKEGHWRGERQHTTRDGKRITVDSLWKQATPRTNRPFAILIINTDITEQRKVQAQFLRSQRMESIGTLAGGIAHDLNNVLAPILMSIELLKMDENEPFRLDALNSIEVCAQRGADMVRQVLGFARGIEGGRLDLRVLDLLRDIEKITRDTFLKSIQVSIEVTPDVWGVMGDPTQLHQVLLNLCVNARDAMPAGGRLALSAQNMIYDESSIGFGDKELVKGRYVVIQVEDSGAGMPAEVLDRIFEPFFTTKDLGKGTGLGLSTSMAIVKSHGGFIRAYSELGTGSRFDVFLPAHLDAVEERNCNAASRLPRGNEELILIVDDEKPVREVLAQTLRAFGYRVIAAADGVEGMAIYAQNMKSIALVITDMMMPNMAGPAFIENLRLMNPDVRILGMSGLSANEEVLKSAQFLPKPYGTELLLSKLRQMLEGPDPRLN